MIRLWLLVEISKHFSYKSYYNKIILDICCVSVYKEISAAIGEVSRHNQLEDEPKGSSFQCQHGTRHEKARNRLRRKLGERVQERKHPVSYCQHYSCLSPIGTCLLLCENNSWPDLDIKLPSCNLMFCPSCFVTLFAKW